MLMEEFKKAHSKMFGSVNGTGAVNTVKENGVSNDSDTKESDDSNNNNANKNGSNNNITNNNNVLTNGRIQDHKILLRPTKSAPFTPVPPLPATTTTTPTGDRITILKTSSPSKKMPPPPVPVKKSSGGPIVTISTYESNQPKNRFLVNGANKSIITVGSSNTNGYITNGTSVINGGGDNSEPDKCENGHINGMMNGGNNYTHHHRQQVPTQQHKPIQIKINLKLPSNEDAK